MKSILKMIDKACDGKYFIPRTDKVKSGTRACMEFEYIIIDACAELNAEYEYRATVGVQSNNYFHGYCSLIFVSRTCGVQVKHQLNLTSKWDKKADGWEIKVEPSITYPNDVEFFNSNDLVEFVSKEYLTILHNKIEALETEKKELLERLDLNK